MAETALTESKVPRTERGRRTMRKLLDAAAKEFAELGFHQASIVSITRRAGVALGSFYTYFDSKDAIFRELVGDMSAAVGKAAGGAVTPGMSAPDIERAALEGFLRFVEGHKEIYRIIDESEFVDPASYTAHYDTVAARIAGRIAHGAADGAFREGLGEVEAWAIMGMNVFLGLRFAVRNEPGDPDAGDVATRANTLLMQGIAAPAP